MSPSHNQLPRPYSELEMKQNYALLETARETCEELLKKAMAHRLDSDELSSACRYAVLSPGKRLRPILLLAITKALNCPYKVDLAAAAVEMFHSASLIADDLPCMDNDDFRRGRPAVHKVYGEAAAIMATYGLISEGYKAIYLNAMQLAELNMPEAMLRGLIAVENVAYNAGIDGASSGQLDDLKLKTVDANPTEALLLEVLRKKTATIFEISCVLGWSFGGGSLSSLDEVKAFAFNLGMAFQIIDDLEDLDQDAKRGPINYPSLIGAKRATHEACGYLAKARAKAEQLAIDTPLVLAILALLEQKMTSLLSK